MKFVLLLTGLCFAMLSCNQFHNFEDEENQTLADTLSNFSGSSSAAVENGKDTIHTFIRTADVKFKVSNVEKVTYKIEDIITSHGGFVTLTQLNSNIDNATTTAISADSSLETTSYTVTNNMIVRVPNTKLDTTLKDIAKLVDYLDYRIIKADDIKLQLHANKLAQKRGGQHTARLANAIDTKGKKLGETTEAEELLTNKIAVADDALLSNMALNDQVSFSTVQLAIYQRPTIKTTSIANHKTIAAYEPGFGTKVLNALQSGLHILSTLFITLLQLWPLFLFGLIGFQVYKKYFRKQVVTGALNKQTS